MRPIFTLHAGEYLVGSHIEEKFKDFRVWLPSKDTGVDLLVTDKRFQKAVSLQVKFSKDFMVREFSAIGWWTLDSAKIESSVADLWVFALYSCYEKTVHHVVIPPTHLLEMLQTIHGRSKKIQTYMCVSRKGRCWEARGLNRNEIDCIANDNYDKAERDLTAYLDNWRPLEDKLCS